MAGICSCRNPQPCSIRCGVHLSPMVKKYLSNLHFICVLMSGVGSTVPLKRIGPRCSDCNR